MAYKPEIDKNVVYVDGNGTKYKVDSLTNDGVNVIKLKSDGTVDKTIYWPESKWNNKKLSVEGNPPPPPPEDNSFTFQYDESGNLTILKDGRPVKRLNIRGPEGKPGKDGMPGQDGAPGQKGQDGATGQPGKDGAPGEKGQDGAPGKDGAPGPEGKQGAPGPKGEDGVYWYPEISKDGTQLRFKNRNNSSEHTEWYDIKGPKGDTGGEGPRGIVGPAGPVFIPSVNSDGELSWSNTGQGLTNPSTRNIKGDKGDKGDKGATFHPIVKDGVLYWYDDNGNLVKGITPVRITGAQGKQGEQGVQGLSAYQIWLKQGYRGTEQDFLDSLKGEKGTPAPPASFSYKDVKDFKCDVQEIDTNLIIDKNDDTDSPKEIIDKRTKEIEDLREKGHSETFQKKYNVGRFKSFFWWCAGADKDLLTMCPGDHSKYVGIGTVILFTALMAWFSSFIAMRLVFGVADKDIWNLGSLGAALFAFFWGSMIFFLDRFITNTMYSDGKVTISKEEFFSGLPRITIAVFLGIVISAPLELIIFDKEIKTELKEELKAEAIRDVNRAETHINDSIAIATAEATEKDLRSHYNKTLNTPNDSAYYVDKSHTVSAGQKTDQYYDKNTGTYKTKVVSAGKNVQTTKEYRIDLYQNQCSQDSNKLAKAIEQTQSLRQKLAKTDSILYKQYTDSIDIKVNKQGLYANLHALHAIAMKDYQPWEWCGPTVDTIVHAWWWYLFNTAIGLIMLLFILIDISPVLYKMMLADGRYDNYLHQEKLLAQDKIRLSLSNMLKKLNESELKRVAPYIMGDVYEKMAGDSYIYKTEQEYKDELKKSNRRDLSEYINKYRNESNGKENINAYIFKHVRCYNFFHFDMWRIWPFSMLRWLLWKEEEKPSAPVIVLNEKETTPNQQAVIKANEDVFNEVLEMKKKIILASYRRWYKTQHDCIICDDVDDENKGRKPFDDEAPVGDDTEIHMGGNDEAETMDNDPEREENDFVDENHNEDVSKTDNNDSEETITEDSESEKEDVNVSEDIDDDEQELPDDDGDDNPKK